MQICKDIKKCKNTKITKKMNLKFGHRYCSSFAFFYIFKNVGTLSFDAAHRSTVVVLVYSFGRDLVHFINNITLRLYFKESMAPYC